MFWYIFDRKNNVSSHHQVIRFYHVNRHHDVNRYHHVNRHHHVCEKVNCSTFQSTWWAQWAFTYSDIATSFLSLFKPQAPEYSAVCNTILSTLKLNPLVSFLYGVYLGHGMTDLLLPKQRTGIVSGRCDSYMYLYLTIRAVIMKTSISFFHFWVKTLTPLKPVHFLLTSGWGNILMISILFQITSFLNSCEGQQESDFKVRWKQILFHII